MEHNIRSHDNFTETKDGEYSSLMEREEFRDLAQSVRQMVEEVEGGSAKVIRADRRNPVVDYGTGKVYLKYEDGNAVASFQLASDSVEERFVELTSGGQSARTTDVGNRTTEQGMEVQERGSTTGTSGVSEADMAEKALGMQDSGGVGEVHKPFTKEQAGYMHSPQPDFDETHSRCRDCAHYDNHGNCRIVPNIVENGYCKQFYADMGFFGHSHGSYVEHNLTLGGDSYEWDVDDAADFSTAVREAIEDMARR